MKQKMTFNFWLYLFGILAMSCTGITKLPLIYKIARLTADHEITTGVVVGVQRTPFDIFKTAKNPPRLVEFTVGGQTYQVASLIQGGRKPAYQKGQQVEVLYVPQNPAIAQINGEQGVSNILIMPSCLVPLVLFPLMFLEVRKSRRRFAENPSLK